MNFEDGSIESGEQYANILIENIVMTDGLFDELPRELMQYWEDGIRTLCIERYDSYIKGESGDYKLCEDDMLNLYKEASLKATQDIINDLVEKGEVQMAVNKNGEIVYGASDWDAIKNKKNRRW